MKSWQTVFGFFRKEFIQALRDPRMRFMLIVTPMIQMLIFGLALSSDVKNIRLASHAEANDFMMQDFTRNALGGGWFIKGDLNISDEVNVFDEIVAGRAEVGVMAPEGGLTQAFWRKDGKIQSLIDSMDLVRSRSIENYIQAIMNETVKENTRDMPPPPVGLSVRLLYNPEMVSAYYLVPGVMCMIICIITIMMTSMSISKEKEIGTFETLISAPISTSEILLGKTIPFLIIGSVNLPLVLTVALVGFDVPMRGHYYQLAIASFFFLMTTVSIGTMISTIARNQQQAMMGGFIFMMPAILLSGIMFPVENMPWPLQIVAAFNPLMYYVTLLRNIMLKGGDTLVLWQYTGALILISAFSVSVAAKRFKLHLG